MATLNHRTLGQVWRNVAIALTSVSLALAVLAASYRRRFAHELVPLAGLYGEQRVSRAFLAL